MIPNPENLRPVRQHRRGPSERLDANEKNIARLAAALADAERARGRLRAGYIQHVGLLEARITDLETQLAALDRKMGSQFELVTRWMDLMRHLVSGADAE